MIIKSEGQKRNGLIKKLAICGVALATVAAGGVSLAKYVVTKGADDQTAHLAKFGITVSASTTSSFTTELKNGDDKAIVKSSSEENVLAPGMAGNFPTLTVTDTDEREVRAKVTVKYSVIYSAEFKICAGTTSPLTLPDSADDCTKFYTPITIGSVTGFTASAAAYDTTKWQVTYTKEVTMELGTTSDALEFTPTWAWAYETTDDTKLTTDDDAADGKVSEAGGKVTLTANVTVVQLQ